MRWIAFVITILLPCFLLGEEMPTEGEVPPSPAAGALTLDECVALTLMRHPRLLQANAQIDASYGLAEQSRLYPNPRIDSGNPQTIGPQKATILTTGLTQEIVTAGKLQLDYCAAQEAARQSEWTRVRTRFEVLTQVRQEFFATLAAQRRQILLEKLVVLAKQSEKTSNNLFDAEQVSETDVLLLRVERRRAELALRTAETTLLGKKRQLAATIGIAENIQSVDGSLSVTLPSFEDDQVMAQVLYSNPLVHVAQLDVTRTQFLLRRAEVDPIPNFSVQGGFQYAYTPIDQRGDHTQALIGIYVNVPLWNQNQGNIFAAQAALRQARAGQALVQQDLTKQLADAMARYRAAEIAVQSYEEGIVPDAMRTLDLVQKAYARGQFEIIRLLQTQRSVFEANLDYISALENRLTAAAEIAGLLQMDEFP